MSLKSKMISGAVWMICMRWSIRGIGLVSTIVLARLLIPEDFGIVAMAMILTSFVYVITEMNIYLFLIREQKVTDELINCAWTFCVIRGIMSATLLVICAPFISEYFSEPKLVDIVYILAAGTFISAFSNIGLALMQKNLEFSKEFKFMVTLKLGTFIITMFFAFYLQNYWALIIGTTFGMVLKSLLSYHVHPYRPKFTLVGWHKVLSFSYLMTLKSIFNFFTTSTDKILIGRDESAETLGAYSMALNIAPLATHEIILPLSKSLTPGYAKISSDRERLVNAFKKTIATIIVFILPIGVGFYATMSEIVPLILGSRWTHIIPLCEVLVIYFTIASITGTYQAIPNIIGKDVWSLMLSIINFLMVVPALYLTVVYGGSLLDIASVRIAVAIIYGAVVISVVFNMLGIKMVEFYYLIRRPFISSYVMFYILSNIPDAYLIVKVFTGAVIYCVVIMLLTYLTDKKRCIEYELYDMVISRVALIVRTAISCLCVKQPGF